MSIPTDEIFFNAQQAADYIHRPYKTLERWRAEENPKLKHVMIDGEIQYRKSDCHAYLIRKIRF